MIKGCDLMDFRLEKAIYIKFHPLLGEKKEVKQYYINIFSYFIRKYMDDLEVSIEIIKLYKKYLEVDDVKYDDIIVIKKNFELLSEWKYQKSNALYYKILLIQDVLYFIDTPNHEKAEEFYNEICSLHNDSLKTENNVLFSLITNTTTFNNISDEWKEGLYKLSKLYKKEIVQSFIRVVGLSVLVWWTFIGLICAGIYSLLHKENYFSVCKKGLSNILNFSKKIIFGLRRLISINKLNITENSMSNNSDMMGNFSKNRDVTLIPRCIFINYGFLKKKQYRVLITATMSAGKSSLLNAIFGKEINQVANEATTNKIRYIYNKSFDDDLINQRIKQIVIDQSLNQLKNTKMQDEVYVRFKSNALNDERIVFIDTPGVNFSDDSSHKEITRNEIKKSNFDLLIYVFNLQHLRTIDDKEHLKFIKENVENKEIIFVINKIDEFDVETDSLESIVQNTSKFLINLGFINPCIIPLSSKAGGLYKKSININLGIKDKRILSIFEDLFKEELNINQFLNYSSSEDGLLMTSGLGILEQEIRSRIYEKNIY